MKDRYASKVLPKLDLVEGWARDGLIDKQIAHNLGIGATTLYAYKDKYPEFAEALKKGKEVVDYQVENALLKKALGYKFEEKTYEKVWNQTLRKYVNVNTKTVVKTVSPDTTAQIFWLKNRKPEKWRDRPTADDIDNGQLATLIQGLKNNE